MNINFFEIYHQKALSSHHSTMREMADIHGELDCPLFFIITRVQSWWWLGVSALMSPKGSAGEMQLGLVF